MQKSYHNRRQQYYINIRRQHKESIMKEKRNNLLAQQMTFQDLINTLQLPPNEQPYNLLSILPYIQKQLFEPIPYFNTERGKIHIEYLGQLGRAIYNERIQPSKQIYQFLLNFLSKNKHREITRNKDFQVNFLNILLNVTVSQETPQNLKYKVLGWVETIDTIHIIKNCIPNEFISVRSYLNVYKIIELALEYPKRQTVIETAEIFSYMISTGDYDDLHDIYEKVSGIMGLLISKTSQFYKHSIDIKPLTECICKLIDTYDSHIVDYGMMGVVLLSAYLIVSQNQQYVLEGINLLKILTQVQNHPQFITYLLNDRETTETKMWDKFGQSTQLYKSPNMAIRKGFHTIIHNIFINGQYEHIIQLTNYFQLSDNKDYLMLLDEVLREEQDWNIIYYLLQNLKTLIYYGNIHRTQSEKQSQSENQSENQSQAQSENPIISKLQANQTLKIIQNLTFNQNERISIQAHSLMEQIYKYQQAKQQ